MLPMSLLPAWSDASRANDHHRGGRSTPSSSPRISRRGCHRLPGMGEGRPWGETAGCPAGAVTCGPVGSRGRVSEPRFPTLPCKPHHHGSSSDSPFPSPRGHPDGGGALTHATARRRGWAAGPQSLPRNLCSSSKRQSKTAKPFRGERGIETTPRSPAPRGGGKRPKAVCPPSLEGRRSRETQPARCPPGPFASARVHSALFPQRLCTDKTTSTFPLKVLFSPKGQPRFKQAAASPSLFPFPVSPLALSQNKTQPKRPAKGFAGRDAVPAECSPRAPRRACEVGGRVGEAARGRELTSSSARRVSTRTRVPQRARGPHGESQRQREFTFMTRRASGSEKRLTAEGPADSVFWSYLSQTCGRRHRGSQISAPLCIHSLTM